MNISADKTVLALPVPQSVPAGSQDAPTGFAAALGSAIGKVEDAQAAAQLSAGNLLLSGHGDVHTVALASQQAELSVELFQQVRNKFVQAYQEIMRMPM